MINSIFISFAIFFFLLNLLIFININKFIKLFSIYDESKSKLNNNKKKTSLIGGTIIFINII